MLQPSLVELPDDALSICVGDVDHDLDAAASSGGWHLRLEELQETADDVIEFRGRWLRTRE